MLGRSPTIADGDLILLYENSTTITPLKIQRGAKLQNKFGLFLHDDFIGLPFGATVHAKTKPGGWLVALRATPELWTKSLSHRTQILYVMDISMILTHLLIKPGSVVVESGTGSGSLSTSIARTVAPHGHLFTFEFNADRVLKARADFELHQLSHLITVTHRDVCSHGFPLIENGVDAVFLDLPNPWVAVPSCKNILVPNGTFCSFSPCIEQVQRTCVALTELGFTRIRTFESLLRTFEVRVDRSASKRAPTARNGSSEPALSGAAAASGVTTVAAMDEDVSMTSSSSSSSLSSSSASSSSLSVSTSQLVSSGTSSSLNDNRKRRYSDSSSSRLLTWEQAERSEQAKHNVVTRPVQDMKGHTGYLTFAHSPPS